MASNAYREQVRNAALAALAGLQAAARDERHDAVVLAAVLERAGDLQRLDEPIPEWCRKWLAAASEATLDAVVAAYSTEMAAWAVPQARVDLAGLSARGDESPGDEGFGFVLRRRDELESATVAILNVSLKRGRAPVQLPSWSAMKTAMHSWDAAIGEVLDRSTAEDLLVERVVLVGRHGWIERLPPPPVTESKADDDAVRAFDEADSFGEPDNVTLEAYLSSGAMQKYVEGYADRAAEFAEKLAEMIDTLKELGELSDALVPRRWHRQYRKAPKEALPYAAPIDRLAAADSEEPMQAHRIDLGAIPGLATLTDARLEVTGDELMLRVYSDGALREVRLGDAVARHEHADNSWVARCPYSAGVVRFRIEDAEGGVFEEHLDIRAES